MASTEVMPSPHLVGSISLDSKIVLITGAGSGINLTFAKLAHHHGARILIADISLTSEAHDLLNSDPTNIKYQRTDVTKWTELEALFSNCLQYFADVPDVVVPGAGVYEPNFSNFWADTENSDEYKTISINVNHVIKLTRLAVRALVSRGKKGVICPVSSQVGLVGVYTSPLYCASKHAVVGFVRSMGPAERFEGVKVVAVCPGGANTNIWDSGGWRETLGIDHIPKDMMCTREQIAQAMFEVGRQVESRVTSTCKLTS